MPRVTAFERITAALKEVDWPEELVTVMQCQVTILDESVPPVRGQRRWRTTQVPGKHIKIKLDSGHHGEANLYFTDNGTFLRSTPSRNRNGVTGSAGSYEFNGADSVRGVIEGIQKWNPTTVAERLASVLAEREAKLAIEAAEIKAAYEAALAAERQAHHRLVAEVGSVTEAGVGGEFLVDWMLGAPGVPEDGPADLVRAYIEARNLRFQVGRGYGRKNERGGEITPTGRYEAGEPKEMEA